jgi:hypothetical protein
MDNSGARSAPDVHKFGSVAMEDPFSCYKSLYDHRLVYRVVPVASTVSCDPSPRSAPAWLISTQLGVTSVILKSSSYTPKRRVIRVHP